MGDKWLYCHVLELNGQVEELIAERDRLRMAMSQIANGYRQVEMTTHEVRALAQESLRS